MLTGASTSCRNESLLSCSDKCNVLASNWTVTEMMLAGELTDATLVKRHWWLGAVGTNDQRNGLGCECDWEIAPTLASRAIPLATLRIPNTSGRSVGTKV